MSIPALAINQAAAAQATIVAVTSPVASMPIPGEYLTVFGIGDGVGAGAFAGAGAGAGAGFFALGAAAGAAGALAAISFIAAARQFSLYSLHLSRQ
jgi:hypothetical protein